MHRKRGRHREEELAEKIFGRGPDDTSGGFSGGLVTIAANEDDGKAFGLAHEQAGSGGKFVGDGDPAEVLATPAVRELFLGTEVTASLTGGSLEAEVADGERSEP